MARLRLVFHNQAVSSRPDKEGNEYLTPLEWLSDIIMQDTMAGLRLVFHNQAVSSRPDKEGNEYLTPLEKAGDKPWYADGYPYLLLSGPSVRELNKVLEEKGVDLDVEETRFRPNIYIEGEFP